VTEKKSFELRVNAPPSGRRLNEGTIQFTPQATKDLEIGHSSLLTTMKQLIVSKPRSRQVAR